jgi:protein-tyrosine phosphatase
MPVHVVFVCMGNICRSPMAEAVFQHMVRGAGLDSQITVDSCGTGGWHAGEPPHSGTRQVLEKNEIPYQHQARQIGQVDLGQSDYLIAMDGDNLGDIQRMGPTGAEVALLLSYAPELNIREVPDPYYTNRFDEVYQMVDSGCRGLLTHIRQKENL